MTVSDLRRTVKSFVLRAIHELLLARLRAEAWFAAMSRAPKAPRIVVTACWSFPIYSQTFVQQEVMALAHGSFSVRFVYAQLRDRSELTHSCAALWSLKRRVLLHTTTGAIDLARFRRRMPTKVEALVEEIAHASGLPRAELLRHDHFLQAFSFARAVEAWRADYLHSYFFYEQSLFALVAARLLGIPRGISCYADHMLDDYALKLVRLHLRDCDLLVATSRRIQCELEMIHGSALGSLLVKANAIDTTNFASRSRRERAGAEPLRLLSVSRLDPKKGIEFLIDAVRLLLDEGVAVEAWIVGEAEPHAHGKEYAGALRARAHRLGVTAAVRFVGRCSSREIRAHLERADIFVAPYVDLPNGDKDGIPTAILEAMAAGCVIVTTDAGSIPEVIDHGAQGLVTAQRDAAALAAALLELAGDGRLAERLGSGATQRARSEYDVGASEVEFHERVRQLITGNRGQPATPVGAR